MTDEARAGEPHPEDFCGRCGGPNLQTWHAPSPLWNTVMRNADGYEIFGGIVCPRCFGELAREAGVADHFCLTTHDAKVKLPTVFGDGRVWDETRCMWGPEPIVLRGGGWDGTILNSNADMVRLAMEPLAPTDKIRYLDLDYVRTEEWEGSLRVYRLSESAPPVAPLGEDR